MKIQGQEGLRVHRQGRFVVLVVDGECVAIIDPIDVQAYAPSAQGCAVYMRAGCVVIVPGASAAETADALEGARR